MKKIILLLLCFAFGNLAAQKLKKLPESKPNKAAIENDMRFLASDELLGRKTGEVGNNIAAKYIAEQFRMSGVLPLNEGSYMQPVSFKKTTPARLASISYDTLRLNLMDDFIVLGGGGIDLKNADVVQLPYAFISQDGSYDDYKGVDVKGKVILTQLGSPDASTPQAIFGASQSKIALAQSKGAIALIEVYTLPIPWNTVKGFFGKESISLAKDTEEENTTHIWLNMKNAKSFFKENGNKMNLSVSESKVLRFTSNNVVGVIPGSDPQLKDEYIALTAHYDHIGHGAGAGNISKGDSIFNGARDNVMGVSAVLNAVRTFAQVPAKRSILFIAYTGEEVGLLGSKFYAEHPLVALKKVVYNLNCDGAGYNDKTKVTVIGLDRTSAEADIQKACGAFGLTAINDPAPEQGLFDRSDNVSMAAKGIPAPDFSPGFTAFDDEIGKYYHMAEDNPDSIDYEYLAKYCQAYVYAARLIAAGKNAPTWKSGDKYEEAFNNLYID